MRNPQADTLLDYLTRRFTYHSREDWLALLRLGRLELAGITATGKESLKEGMVLRFSVVDYLEPDVPLDFHILERSTDLCFVHKPAGMPVHRTGKIFFQTLANLVKEELGDPSWAPLNRLDRETGGLVAFARGADAFREYAPSAPSSHWTKFYVAIVRGTPPTPAGILNQPLAENPASAIRCQMYELAHGKPALTLYRTIASQAGLSLLVLSPITGRKHQLRAHLAGIGCPVVGDKIYSFGGKAYLKQLDQELTEADILELGASHHLLHSFCLRIGTRGQIASEAWDWNVGTEFSRIFPVMEARVWCATSAFRDLFAEAEAAQSARQS